MNSTVNYSESRIEELRESLSKEDYFEGMTIYCTGSYARNEAHEYSDIDIFLWRETSGSKPNTQSILARSSVINAVSDLHFPEFSKDCEYLDVFDYEEMSGYLGTPKDDHTNFFTARMLLILESKCIVGVPVYRSILEKVVSNYFIDYDGHREEFKPFYLMNDIRRYWATLLLNYECFRSQVDVERRYQNYKLKYSRMFTCFATLCYLGSMEGKVTHDRIYEMVSLTPMERFLKIKEFIPAVAIVVDEIVALYDVFLSNLSVSWEDIEVLFSDDEEYNRLTLEARSFGDKIFYDLIKKNRRSLG